MEILIQRVKILGSALLFVGCLFMGQTSGETSSGVTIQPRSAAVDVVGAAPAKGEGAYIDWSQKVIIAKGIGGPIPGTKSPALKKAQALTAAKVVAQRNLLEAIQGAHILSTTLVENNQLIKEEVASSVQGTVRGAQEIDRQYVGDDLWEITLAIPMYPNLSSPIMGAIVNHTPREALPVPTVGTLTAIGGYTGVVVDVGELPLNRTFSPVIYDESGRAIYGHMNIDPDFAMSQGMVDYAATASDIEQVLRGQSRAGINPLVVRATALRDHNNNVIIQVEDADLILAENQAQGFFLERCQVVFKQ